jgi:hypothetical protein
MSAVLSTLAHHGGTIANLRWNPTFRGILFPSIQFFILCGSCYLLLATNLGNRLGFLVSSAAFWGWMVLMTTAWMIYGIGLKGPDPKWVVQEAITDTHSAQVAMVARIPNEATTITPKGWRVVRDGVPMRGEAQSAIDANLIPTGQVASYVPIAGYDTGGKQRLKIWPKIKKWQVPKTDPTTKEVTFVDKKGKWYNPGDYTFRGLLHSKHYYVGQVQPMLMKDVKVNGTLQYDANGKAKQEAVKKDGKILPDATKPVTSVVLIRDLGSRRQPPFVIFLCSFVLLGLSLFNLHRRDKQVMAAMAQFAKAA